MVSEDLPQGYLLLAREERLLFIKEIWQMPLNQEISFCNPSETNGYDAFSSYQPHLGCILVGETEPESNQGKQTKADCRPFYKKTSLDS